MKKSLGEQIMKDFLSIMPSPSDSLAIWLQEFSLVLSMLLR